MSRKGKFRQNFKGIKDLIFSEIAFIKSQSPKKKFGTYSDNNKVVRTLGDLYWKLQMCITENKWEFKIKSFGLAKLMRVYFKWKVCSYKSEAATRGIL